MNYTDIRAADQSYTQNDKPGTFVNSSQGINTPAVLLNQSFEGHPN